MGKEYIPYNDVEFDLWLKFLIDYTEQKCFGDQPAWDPGADWTGVRANLGALHAARETREKTAYAEHVIRSFVNRYLRFPPVMDEGRDNVGIPKHDPIPTPVPKPKDAPEVEVSMPLPQTLRFRFKRIGAKQRRQPAGVRGLELGGIS